MLSAQPVVRNPRVSERVPPEEVSRMHEAIAKCQNSAWWRLFAKLYQCEDLHFVGPDIAEMSLACSEGLPGSGPRDRILNTLRDWRARSPSKPRSGGASSQGTPASSRTRRTDTGWSSCAPSCRAGSRSLAIRSTSGSTSTVAIAVISSFTARFWVLGARAPTLHCYAWRSAGGLAIHFGWYGRSATVLRWEEPGGERFNIECTCPGFVSPSDEHYRTWGLPFTQETAADWRLLANLTPREELAFLLDQRGTVPARQSAT